MTLTIYRDWLVYGHAWMLNHNYQGLSVPAYYTFELEIKYL